MELEFSAASKTFLFGEYLALNGGPALLLNTLPRFTLKVTTKNSALNNRINLFKLNSPADKFLSEHLDIFRNLQLKFNDPYHGLGGFGASSAQFVLLYAIKNYLENLPFDSTLLLEEYKKYTKIVGPYQPSGADVVAQLYGGLVYFARDNNRLEKFTWPFTDLTFVLLHTHNKIPTHLHLQQLNPINFAQLEPIAATIYNSILSHDADAFCHALNAYGDELQHQGLITDSSRKLIQTIRAHPLVRAAKGCGALGSDVICVMLDPLFRAEFIAWAKAEQLDVMDADHCVQEGLAIKDRLAKDTQVLLVNDADIQIGLAEKLTAHQNGQQHRAYSICLFRENKGEIEMLLQQRASNKYHSKNLWSNACCSHPAAGEEMLIHANQRLQNEMGISVPLHEIGIYRYRADCGDHITEHEIDHIFIGRVAQETIRPNPAEVADYRWIAVNKVKQDLKQHPEKYTAWLSGVLKLILQQPNLRTYLQLNYN